MFNPPTPDLTAVDTAHLFAEMRRRGYTVARTEQVQDYDLSKAERPSVFLHSREYQDRVLDGIAAEFGRMLVEKGALWIDRRSVESPTYFWGSPGEKDIVILRAGLRVILPFDKTNAEVPL